MVTIRSVVLWLFVKYCSCQSPCMNELVADGNFSISMEEHIKEESEMCIRISYNLTVPANKGFIPYEKIWFEGNPSQVRSMETVKTFRSETGHTYIINGLAPGEHEYGLKLKWGCNQTYIFPNRVKISVTGLTKKPRISLPSLIEGNPATIGCRAPHLCSGGANIKFNWAKHGEQLEDLRKSDGLFFIRRRDLVQIIPTADDHNTTITCVAKYRNSVINSTVTLNVEFPPKIQRDSRCLVEGELLVCVCISRGNPLPPVTWPLEVLIDYSVKSYSSSHTVNSTLTLPVGHYPNTTVKCISSNKLGWDELEIKFEILTNGFRMTDALGCRQTYDAAPLWLTAVSFSLNVVLIAALVVYIYKLKKSKQRKHAKKTDVYASLRKTDVEQEYSVISPQPK